MVASGRELRVATHADGCPAARVDGTARPMRPRAAEDEAFAVGVCSLPLQPADRVAEVAGERLVLPRAAPPRRIVILGDTGCRVKGRTVQACDDPKAWPFPQVAARAAARRPDLIVHVGDYLYRESPCPQGDVHCAGSPHGDTWAAWTADFFAPAGRLLTAAPWVFVRGNHESCARAGLGWFRLLDAAPQPPTCPAESAPFAVDIGGTSLVVLDSADTADREVENDRAFRAQYEAALKLAPSGPVWIVTHRPVWAVAPAARLGPLGQIEVGLNRSEQVALHGEDLSRVDLVLSGHIHEFESLDFGAARPPQLVVGTGGDVTEAGATPAFTRRTVDLDGLEAKLLQFARFGYLVLDRTRTGWAGRFYDACAPAR
jgi:predicted phosphodiesterase